jgi:hypothetical protein
MQSEKSKVKNGSGMRQGVMVARLVSVIGLRQTVFKNDAADC